MHTKEAKKFKVSDQKLNNLSVWREVYIFSDEEKVVEKMTLTSEKGGSDELYIRVKRVNIYVTR